MSRFRIKANDTIKASCSNKETGKFLSSIYDSGFTTIGQVENALMRKIQYTNAKHIDICIVNQDEQTSKTYTKKVN
jgi:hypothetical protein